MPSAIAGLEPCLQPSRHEVVGPFLRVAEIVGWQAQSLRTCSTWTAAVDGALFYRERLVGGLECIKDHFIRAQEVVSAIGNDQDRLRDAAGVKYRTGIGRCVVDARDIVRRLLVAAVGAKRMRSQPYSDRDVQVRFERVGSGKTSGRNAHGADRSRRQIG